MLLEEVMETPSMNAEVQNQIQKMNDYISEKKYDKAEEIANKLDELTQGYAQGVARARVLIARGKRSEKNNQG